VFLRSIKSFIRCVQMTIKSLIIIDHFSVNNLSDVLFGDFSEEKSVLKCKPGYKNRIIQSLSWKITKNIF